MRWPSFHWFGTPNLSLDKPYLQATLHCWLNIGRRKSTLHWGTAATSSSSVACCALVVPEHKLQSSLNFQAATRFSASSTPPLCLGSKLSKAKIAGKWMQGVHGWSGNFARVDESLKARRICKVCTCESCLGGVHGVRCMKRTMKRTAGVDQARAHLNKVPAFDKTPAQ